MVTKVLYSINIDSSNSNFRMLLILELMAVLVISGANSVSCCFRGFGRFLESLGLKAFLAI